jgi:1-acyl-sn-glycerol-3-phosphate acyltransferase
MTLSPITRFVNWGIRGLSHLICKVDTSQLSKIPNRGPLIIVLNHVNFLDAPIISVHVLPKPLTALVKIETWRSPILGPLFTMWEAIPIRRGEADLTAFQAAQQALKDCKMVAVAPEGTRSGDGKLHKGLPGVVLLALRSGAPMLPVVYYGHENYKEDFKHLRRAPFHIVVGEPFRLKNIQGVLGKDLRGKVTDEIMYQLAALLPEKYRGSFADMSKATKDYLAFDVKLESEYCNKQVSIATSTLD